MPRTSSCALHAIQMTIRVIVAGSTYKPRPCCTSIHDSGPAWQNTFINLSSSYPWASPLSHNFQLMLTSTTELQPEEQNDMQCEKRVGSILCIVEVWLVSSQFSSFPMVCIIIRCIHCTPGAEKAYTLRTWMLSTTLMSPIISPEICHSKVKSGDKSGLWLQ